MQPTFAQRNSPELSPFKIRFTICFIGYLSNVDDSTISTFPVVLGQKLPFIHHSFIITVIVTMQLCASILLQCSIAGLISVNCSHNWAVVWSTNSTTRLWVWLARLIEPCHTLENLCPMNLQSEHRRVSIMFFRFFLLFLPDIYVIMLCPPGIYLCIFIRANGSFLK